MAKTLTLETLDYTDFLLFTGKPVDFFIRDGKEFFYCDNVKVEIKGDEITIGEPGEDGKLFGGRKVKVSEVYKNADMKISGQIAAEIAGDNSWLAAFIPNNRKKHAVYVLAVGQIDENYQGGKVDGK